MSGAIRQAVFLVGGRGTRLGEIARDTPKPLLEIAPGVRFLDVVLEEAARHGFDDIVLLAGHMGDQVEAAYAGRVVRGATVRVVREPSPQGTGGALAFARAHLADWFLMGNGDSLFEINLRALAADRAPGMLGRLALRSVPDPGRYGSVEIDGDRVAAFREKDPTQAGPALINGGLYVLSREVADAIEGPCSIEADVFPRLAAADALRGRPFDGWFLDMGLPDTYARACAEVPARRARPIAFLDRDGVLNVDRGYTHRPEDLEWTPGAREAVRLLNDAGMTVIVVTNQAGVARGFYDEAAVDRFHAAMSRDLADAGAHVDAFLHCPFHPDAVVAAYRHPDHPDRKPNPGMLLKAMADWPHRREASFLIGDRESDLEAATAAGVRGHLHQGGDLADLARRALREAGINPGPDPA